MNFMLATDAQWEAYYAANAVKYRAQAEAFRCEARAALIDPLHADEYRKARAAEYLALADSYEEMARECLEVDA
jgi:hypothetical protein